MENRKYIITNEKGLALTIGDKITNDIKNRLIFNTIGEAMKKHVEMKLEKSFKVLRV